MNQKTIPFACVLALCLLPAVGFAQGARQISIRVVDERDKPVKGARVRARYLASIHEGGQEYRVPLELANPQTTDAIGQCSLILQDVSWSLAAVEATRSGMKTEDAIPLYDDAPLEPAKREAFERQIEDLVERYSTAHRLLDPSMDANQVITLKMKRTIKVTGHLHVDGKPLAKALITIFSTQSQIDQLFARSSPSLTDEAGQFTLYAIPGELNRARIVVERANGNRILDLTGLSAQRTPEGLRFELETIASDYVLK